jgi:hypothetical protein
MLRAIKGIRVIKGFRSSPAQSCIIRRSFYDSDEDLESHWVKRISPKAGTSRVADFADIRFDEAFDAVSCQNIHDVGLGGYVEVSQGMLDRYLPEGLAGEMNEEFEMSERCIEITVMQIE